MKNSADAEPARYVQQFEMRWFMHAELTHSLYRCGLRVTDTYGNFNLSPLTDASPEQVIVTTLL